MGKFRGNGRKSGGGFNRGGFGGKKSFGGNRSGGRPNMHRATCNECGADCEIPFKPTGDRPVFCSKCFNKQSGGDRQRKIFSDRKDHSKSDDGQMHDAVCVSCGKNCQVPFRPTAGKPVYCDDCFKSEGGKNRGNSEMVEQIKQLHLKIDQLIKILSPEIKEKPKALVEKTEKKKAEKVKKVATVKEKKTKTVAKKKPAKKTTKKK